MKLPSFARSLRFRLSGMTVAVAFGIGGLALGVVYLAVLYQVRSLTMRTLVVTRQPIEISGQTVLLPQLSEAEVRTFESVFKEMILNQVAVITIAVLAGLFLLSLVTGWFVAGRALRPIGRITSVAQEIEATDLTRRIGLDGPDDELTRMASTFDAMLDRLDRAFRSQQEFLAQTSHDLRTPLAVIRTNLDVTLSNEDATVDDWRATGEILRRATERMSAMIDDLLAAARMEIGAAQLVSLDLSEVVCQAVEELEARAIAEGRQLRVSSDPVVVDGDHTSLTRAVTNLVDNALRVTSPGSEVVVATGQLEEWAYLAVADRGPGIDPAVVRGESAGGRRGLGLTIVREIATSHRGRLDALPRRGGGSVLTLWIPRSGITSTTDPPSDALPVL